MVNRVRCGSGVLGSLPCGPAVVFHEDSLAKWHDGPPVSLHFWLKSNIALKSEAVLVFLYLCPHF